jgi:hypothetical protein
MAELNRRLPPHRYQGEGANRLPDAHHFVTTVYFDTPSRSYFRAAEKDVEHNVKVRAKEYYDLHPSLAELATDPAELVRYQPWVWFELKRRDGTHVSKRRFRMRKRDVPAVFVEGRVTPDSFSVTEASDGEGDAADALREIVDFCQKLEEPLSATCVVNYRRLSWQTPDCLLRVTIDLGLAFFAPPSDLWVRTKPLVRNSLGSIVETERRAVLEIKRQAGIPSWLGDELARTGVRAAPYSKFVMASRAVSHG